jgi:hypothetical protein
MKNKKTIEELEKELAGLKEYHRSISNTYGSELCAGDMFAQEEKLEKEIAQRKQVKKQEEAGTVWEKLEPSDPPVVKTKTIEPIGIQQLRELKEKTTKRWKESGLLDGLTGGVPDNLAKMFESKTSYIINEENKNFSRTQVIELLDEFSFFLSDNGDPDTTGKEWLDMQYPEK